MVNIQELRKYSALIGVVGITVGALVGPSANPNIAALGWAALIAGCIIFGFPIAWIPWHQKSVDAEIGHMAANFTGFADYGDGHAESVMWNFPELDEIEAPQNATNLDKSERFRKFVWAESANDARVRKIGNPILPKVYCPNKECHLALDAGTVKCPTCGTALPTLPETEKPTKNPWKTPEDIKTGIDDALKKVEANGGITIYKGRLRRSWVRMDGRDWYEKCTIVVPKKTDLSQYFGDPRIMLSPFVEFGMLIQVKCYYAHYEKLCNSEAGQPIFMVKDSAWELHKSTQQAQNQLKESDVAIATLMALNGAENKDVAVVQEREEKNEAKNEAHFWKTKHTLKQMEVDTIRGQIYKKPAEHSNRAMWALFLTSVLSAVFGFLYVFNLVVK